ncbi:MAG: hydantoinase/oxoprolinase family protein [Rhizobiales bacterium]|mgnify:CR=1 FL=1|nr:hydantoinase/oxoprolinase family protein [Hyphomicrobiales bacterium]
MRNVWIGIDTGGTFTDLVLVDVKSGNYIFHKVPTTPEDASKGILTGISEILDLARFAPADVGLLSHGTTLATNAVLEGKWAPTGMITTEGFRDVLELARQRRPSFFNLDIPKPVPPALREARIEVPERVGYDGEIVTPLDTDAVRAATRKLRDLGCESVAICFLHSYATPEHEQRARDAVKAEWPEAYVCASSDILAEFREYERFATATVNASLMPVMDRYLQRFENGVRSLGIPDEPRVMQSNGGAVSPDAVRRAPVNTFFSGPAGGVIGAASLGVAAEVNRIITFDMGGTSTDVCLIRDGNPNNQSVREMGGFPVRTRTLDIHTIGAGGGSIAWVDPGRLIKVGPKSAGARPGPACYGRGGELPTVSDANMALGRLNQKTLLDGRMPVYPERARVALEKHLCQPLGIDLERAASGVLEIVNVNMMGAVRVISVEQGEDPRTYALMPFGGAGPLHAADVARTVGMPTVFVPQRPGLLSAIGLLHADARGDFSVTRLVPMVPGSLAGLKDGIEGLRERAEDWLKAEKLDKDLAIHEWHVDMRYFGQNSELSTSFNRNLTEAELERLAEVFHGMHEQNYGYRMPEQTIEVVNLRLTVIVRRPVPPAWKQSGGGESIEKALIEVRPVWFAGTGFVDTKVYRRESLPADATLAGPVIIEQMDTTTVVPPHSKVRIDRIGNIFIDLETVR